MDFADYESQNRIFNLCYWFINMAGVGAGNINRKVETIAKPQPEPAQEAQGSKVKGKGVSYTRPGESVGSRVISKVEAKDDE